MGGDVMSVGIVVLLVVGAILLFKVAAEAKNTKSFRVAAKAVAEALISENEHKCDDNCGCDGNCGENCKCKDK